MSQEDEDAFVANQPIHQGKKLLELLEAAGKNRSDLARVTGLTPTSMSRYTAAPEINDRAWLQLGPGLQKLGIDPNKLRPYNVAPMVSISSLIETVNMFEGKQLDALGKILSANDHERIAITAIVEDRLATRRKK